MKRTQDINGRLNRVVGGWNEDEVRLEKTSLKSRFKREVGEGGERRVYSEEKEKSQEDSRVGLKRVGRYV